jgi:hypothetical protein
VGIGKPSLPERSIKPDRFVIAIAACALLLVVVGFASVIVVQRQPSPPPDLSTPDGTVLAYLQAYRSGSESDLRPYFSQRLNREIDSRPTPPGVRPPVPRQVPTGESQRVQIVDTKLAGDRATVTISLTTFRVDSPVSPSEYTYQMAIPLVREGQNWKVDQEIYPG